MDSSFPFSPSALGIYIQTNRDKTSHVGNREKPVSYTHLDVYKRQTYGITVYQEQVMLLSRLLAGFTRGQSDELRKAMGKKLIDKMVTLKEKFIEGGKKNGHDEKILNKIWADWEKFASYAFNKSHAVCYSLIAYQTAWLKANYPSEYMASVLSNNLNNLSEITKFMDECKAMDINVLSPDVNESLLKFSVNKNGDIRFGLAAIKSVGQNAARNIIDERMQNGPFKDIFDFVERINLSSCNKKTIEALALAGAFDSLPGITREQFLGVNSKGEEFLDSLIRYGNKYQVDKQTTMNSLFANDSSFQITHPEIPKVEEWTDLERLNKERDLIGIYLSAHPLDDYACILNYVCTADTVKLNDLQTLNGKEISFGGIITHVREGQTRRGSPYTIFKLEDYVGNIEIALFGEDSVNYGRFARVGLAVYITAKVQPKRYRPEELEIKINSISLLPDVKDKLISKITLQIPLSEINDTTVTELSALLKNNSGNSLLYFQIIGKDAHMNVQLFSRPMRIDAVSYTHLVKIDINAIDMNDPKTYRLYSEGKTTGTFQFESAGMQKYLKELQPTKFEDLIAMNALYRPGPMDYIPSFIARKHGREEITYDIPVMEKDVYKRQTLSSHMKTSCCNKTCMLLPNIGVKFYKEISCCTKTRNR